MKNVSTTMSNTKIRFLYKPMLILVCFFFSVGAENIKIGKKYHAKALASYDRPEGIFVSVLEFMDIDRETLQQMQFQFHFCPIGENKFKQANDWSRSPSFFHKNALAGIWYKIKIKYKLQRGTEADLGWLDLEAELRGFRPKTVFRNGQIEVVKPQAYNPARKKIYNTYLRSYLDQAEILQSNKCYGLSFLSLPSAQTTGTSEKMQEADLTEVVAQESGTPTIFEVFSTALQLIQEKYESWSPDYSISQSDLTSQYFYRKYKKLLLLSQVEVSDIPAGFQNAGDTMYTPGVKLKIKQDHSSSILSNQYTTLDKFMNTQGIHIWQEIPCSEEMDLDLILEAQSALKKLGYYQKLENGKFDSHTKLAITKFQLERGLPIGNLDLKTLAYLGIQY